MGRKVTAEEAYRFINTHLTESATRWFQRLKDEGRLNDPSRTGFYIGAFDITDPEHPILICLCLIGVVADAEKRAKYIQLVERKCVVQLGAYPRHISSAQSVGRDKESYPGAVRGNPMFWEGLDIAVSASGLHGLDDETIAAQGSVDCRLNNHLGDLHAIAQASGNKMLESLI